jgi:hypothetical protein
MAGFFQKVNLFEAECLDLIFKKQSYLIIGLLNLMIFELINFIFYVSCEDIFFM